METKLKQRVIGAVVLTTLAIIVLPMLLDGSAQDRARINASIPVAPKIEIKTLTIPQVKQAMLEMERRSASKLPVEIQDPDQEPSAALALNKEPSAALDLNKEPSAVLDLNKKPSASLDLEKQLSTAPETSANPKDQKTPAFQLDVNDLPISWSLQLGSFRLKDNAVNLRQSLRDSEYRTYILTADSSEGQVYRVFVGPMLNKNDLREYASDIESKFELKGQIVRYRIAEDANQLGG